MPSGSRNVTRSTPSSTACGSGLQSPITVRSYRPVPLLDVDRVTRRFGGILALDELSLAVEDGEVHGLIGPNGAGKTTAFNVITRLYAPDSGTVRYRGEDLLSVPP